MLHSDPHDFAGLYIRHRTAFTLLARRYLRDQRDADDVVQEAFLRLFLALPELETELQALAYCRRTITNLCIDRYRAQARRPSLVDIGTIPLEELPDEDRGDPVVRAEDAALVREALSMLSPLHRAALVKREIEEKSLPVIAQELEVPEDSVKHLLFRARRALRRLLVGTSLEPGSDAEGGLALLTRAGPGGVAAFLLLMVLGLGSGPEPAVDPGRRRRPARDHPGDRHRQERRPRGHRRRGRRRAVRRCPDRRARERRRARPAGRRRPVAEPHVRAPPTSAAPVAPAPAPAPAAPSPSPASTVTPAPAPEPSAPGKPSSSPSPSASPSGSPSATPSPTAVPTKEPEPSTGPKPSEPAPSASPSPSASPASPSPEASPLPVRAEAPKTGRVQELSERP